MSNYIKKAIDAAMFSAGEDEEQIITNKINSLREDVQLFDRFIKETTPWHVYIAASPTNTFRDDKLVYNNPRALDSFIEVQNGYGVLKNEK
ncbi:hypothetical protein OF376_01490 [Ureaplasma miroungigenitalium]|uniref:Uncharacterized protein n=1 Tax=Ureaplasma miroungigenitalium TaxID=1042321 RepID=A0ABT3BMI7_9BACT|nr:hypothetical protein [Ureaplasma miroungigenitalium]MCV3728439.1 hypothetical protein [Ureaplasma miroungigenitalium]MCV3734226.1 hypothetical protein [Ureaplasma miroungigenitalium]